jgi:hypothetical protein
MDAEGSRNGQRGCQGLVDEKLTEYPHSTPGQRMKGCAPIFRKISLNGWDAAPL